METDNGRQQILGSPETSPSLQRLISDDAVGQLRRCEGLMARLGSEDGVPKLDWVEGISRLLEDSTKLEEMEVEARDIWKRGIRYVIWAGMGGSVLTVRVLTDMGFCSGDSNERITIYPLDSTDPAALNEIVRRIAEIKHLAPPSAGISPDPTFLRELLNDVLMVGVAMGMTSEEPITHLTWFTELLEQGQLLPAEHLLVMTLPGSYLDQFAEKYSVPTRPLQLDGRTGTGGRMSAPTTRVFLLPAALYLTRLSDEPGQLRQILRHAWEDYNLAQVTEHPADSPFVQLAAVLSETSTDGACRLLLQLPGEWQALVAWIEQLMEESLGKGGKGIVVFKEQPLNPQAPGYSTSGLLHVHVTAHLMQQDEKNLFTLYQPYMANSAPQDRLAALATSFLGWQLTMALYGYLHRITFAGQSAVENYKARARRLRTLDDPLEIGQNWDATATDNSLEHSYTLLTPQGVEIQGSPARIFARTLQQAVTVSDERGASLRYLDFTINGKSSVGLLSIIEAHLHLIGNELLGVPVKLRYSPAAYHSTEQSEMDGPPFLVSLRILARDHEASILGSYTDTFLCAQAISTWQAMLAQGRSCFLLLIDGSLDEAVEPLEGFFSDVATYLR